VTLLIGLPPALIANPLIERMTRERALRGARPALTLKGVAAQ
jgi:hypothetical protein